MEQLELTFRANNQCLEATNFTPPLFVASNTVDWIVAKFDLGTNWDCWSLGAVKAIWKFKGQQYSAILNAEGVCTVPHEVLGAMTGEVKVNLVASTIEDDEVVERLTTYPLYCINVNKVALIDGDNSVAITPSEYEQFVEDVQEYAQDAYDAKIGAEQSADSASSSAGIASDMADTATQAKNVAVQQAQLAVDAKEAAQTAQGLAESAKDSAIDAKERAESARDSAIEAKNAAQGYAQDAEEASQSILGLQATAEVDANVGTPSVNVSVSEVGGNKVMDFDFHNLKGVQGETGANGEDGADGFSPTVEVTPTEDGNEVTITDKNGEHTFEVLDGNIEDFYPFLPTDTASGSIASFPDGAENIPMSSVKASINPIQDLHGQSSPYPAGGGKNKIDDSQNKLPYSQYGVTISKSETTYTIVVDSATGYPFVTVGKVYGLKAGTYTLSGIRSTGLTSSNASIRIANRTVTPAVTCSGTFTLNADVTSELLVELAFTGASLTDGTYTIKDVQLEEGSTATTYAPYSNICPISGTTEVVVTRGGINQWDEEWEVGSLSPTTGELSTSGDTIRSKNFIPVKPNTAYFLKTPSSSKDLLPFFYDSNHGFINTGTWSSINAEQTTPLNCAYMKFRTAGAYGTTYNHDISINYPSTDHDYHSYITPLTITTELGQTVYGGTLDVVSGELTVTEGRKVFDGSEDEGWYLSPYNYYGSATIADAINENTSASNQLCDVFPYGNITNQNQTTGICLIWGYIRVREATIVALEDWKTYLSNNPMTVVYKLATPTTIQLTPQEVTSLLGGNTVWADSGNVEVTYKADIQKYIDKKISAVLNA